MTKVLIVEDEMPSARKLKKFILDIDPNFEIVDILDSVKDTIYFLQNNTVDLLFLDIHLSDGNSFKIFDSIKIDTPIIFTTAFNQYAIEAFKLVSIDYLLKPLNKERLKESINKFKKIHYNKQSTSDTYDVLKEILHESSGKDYRKRFLIHYREQIKVIKTKEIASFYADSKSVFILTFSNKIYDVNLTLEQLEQMLNPKMYFRANRKCLINIDSIKNAIIYSKNKLKLNTLPQLPFDIIISSEKTPKFKQWLNQ